MRGLIQTQFVPPLRSYRCLLPFGITSFAKPSPGMHLHHHKEVPFESLFVFVMTMPFFKVTDHDRKARLLGDELDFINIRSLRYSCLKIGVRPG